MTRENELHSLLHAIMRMNDDDDEKKKKMRAAMMMIIAPVGISPRRRNREEAL